MRENKIKTKSWRNAIRACAAAVVSICMIGGVASAATIINYAPPAIPGATVNFTTVTESSGTDAVPLYGTPTTPLSGNDLTFDNMAGFTATSTSGSPAIDFVDGLLNVTVQAKPGQTITSFNLSEFGDYSLARLLNPTGAASAYPTSPGLLVTIREINGVGVNIGPAVAPLVYVGTPPYTFTGSELVKTGTWTASGSYTFNTPNVTRFEVSIDNQLYAASEVGTSASISKKGLDLSVATSQVPEPATLGMIGAAGLILIRRRTA